MKFHQSPIAKGLVCTAAGSMLLFQASGFSLSSVEAQQKTSIQQELEKLYQQEGRQAPNMELKALPRETLDGRVFQESADPKQPPQAVSPQQQKYPVRQATPGTQTSAAYDARDRRTPDQPAQEQTVKSPAPKKPGLLNRMNGFDRLMFWKKNKQKEVDNIQEEAVAETPAMKQPAYQPPSAQPAAPPTEYPTTRYQRPTQNRPAVSTPRTLPSAQQSAPVRTARPFPGTEATRQTVTVPAQPTRSGKMPVIIPQGQDRPAQALPQPSRVVNTAAPEAPSQTTPEPVVNGKSLPPAPAAFGTVEPVQPVSKPDPVVEKIEVEIPQVDAPVTEMPAPVEEPAQTVAAPPQQEVAPAAKLPSLDELPKEPVPIIPEEEPKPETPPQVDEFFPDPFTEMSEDKADSSKEEMTIPDIRIDMNDKTPLQPIPEIEDDVAPALPQVDATKTPAPQPMPVEEAPDAKVDNQLLEDENPFSGLKLEEPSAALPMIDVEEQAAPSLPVDAVPALPMETESAPSAAPSLPELNPAFEDEFKLPVKKETSEEPIPELPVLEKIPDAAPQLPAAEQGDISWEEEEARRGAKLDLIAAREGETGLKGFCIVALRDHRDLIDALPAFRSTYNLRTYHFSSLETKIEFDKDPRKYVPAYDGNDPILLSTQSEEREGSLDYALWFKGRLYLFTTYENLEIFQLDPVLYAEN